MNAGRRLGAETIARVRSLLLGLTGIACLAYAGLALWQDRPDPAFWWVPGVFGAASALAIFALALLAGPRAVQAATDEVHTAVSQRAQRQAYWVSMALFLLTALLASPGLLEWRTALAVLGALMGAAFPLLFVWHDVRMR
jgi:hypothetical protein